MRLLPKMKVGTVSVRQAFTIVEVMMAVAISAIVLAAIGTLTVYTARSFVALGNYEALDRYSRNALDVMSRDIRQARAVTSYATNSLTFQNTDGSTLSYDWSPSISTLTRRQGGVSTVLLTNCDTLRFNIYQRNPSNNFSFYPAANIANCKLVSVTWVCSRTMFGRKLQTESVQTAKIVIRN
jgi:prepilin-type N-terminal cleavage/methylation domain-containing protein